MEIKPLVLNPPLNVTFVKDGAGLDKLSDFFKKQVSKVIGWDVETPPAKDFYWRPARTIQFGNTNEQFVIDLLPFVDGNHELLQTQGQFGKNLSSRLKPIVDVIEPVVCSGDWLKVGVVLSFEYMTHLWNFGLRTWNFFDCSLVERCIWAGDHSLKDYKFYDMENMMLRYFQTQINKELQMSFNLTDELTQEQIEYAALDTRLPLGLRALQNLVISGKKPVQLGHLPPYLFGDDLREIAQIENNAIGPFVDMHINGECLDCDKWTENINARKTELETVLHEMDKLFIPIVGSKHQVITQEQLDAAEAKWKAFNIITDQEIELKGLIKKEKDLDEKAKLEAKRVKLEGARKLEKEVFKEEHYALRRTYSALKKLIDKCEGEALINYDSGVQLLEAFGQMHKELKKLDETGDDALQEYAHIPVIKLLQKYRELSKEINTYGMSWTQKWMTHPCKDEGWLHPGDGKLHSQYNQYDAETGRSSSEKPNGQNIKTEKEIRSCFIVEPPNEAFRISICCEERCGHIQDNDTGFNGHVCLKCFKPCETKGEEYVYVKADMSGAELRILAELSGETVWIDAFNRGEDLHAVCTEIQYPDEWPALAVEGCAYFKLKENGEPQRFKCKCPKHSELRDETKVPNFLIPYGGGPSNLATQLKKPLSRAKEILEKHRQSFPILWAYLEKSGNFARKFRKSLDMFGRRRLFPEPTWERALYKAKEDRKEKLLFPKEVINKNIADFIAKTGRAPLGKLSEVDSEKWILTHRKPTDFEVGNAFKAMNGSIERAGKNHPIQSTNATIAKVSMGCGFDLEGRPFLWHVLPKYKAKMIKFVHDELVYQVPKRFAEAMKEEILSAFKRAAAIKMKLVIMEGDANIEVYWKK